MSFCFEEWFKIGIWKTRWFLKVNHQVTPHFKWDQSLSEIGFDPCIPISIFFLVEKKLPVIPLPEPAS